MFMRLLFENIFTVLDARDSGDLAADAEMRRRQTNNGGADADGVS